MIELSSIREIAQGYRNVRIGAIGSHSALDICDGARDEGIETWVYCQKGRERTYARYFVRRRTLHGVRGPIDRVILLTRFADILHRETLKEMVDHNVIFVPNRALTSYLSVDDVESRFEVPIFGSRSLLRSEERGGPGDYYHLLEKAGLPHPARIERPEDIDRLVMVKLPHATKRLERGFFTAASPEEFRKRSAGLLSQGTITKADLERARIEEYIIGPVFNLNFFRSPLVDDPEAEIELLGIDWRFESSLDGHVRLPAQQQLTLPGSQAIPEYTVCGHNSATLRESLLEGAFALAERYVDAARRHYPPGIIGPFCLQTCVDKDLRFYIYDVAPRIGGGTNVHLSVGHPYGNTLWNTRMSTGRRIALEVRTALQQERLPEVVT